MTKEEAYRYIDNLKWLKGYDNTTIDGKTVGEILDEIKTLLKEQEAKPMTEYDDGWDCPRCGLKLVGKTASGYPCDELDLPNDEIVKYCPVCGQAVEWDD